MANIEGLKNLINSKQELIKERLKDEKVSEVQKKSILFWRDLLDYCDIIIKSSVSENIPNYIINNLHNNIADINTNILYNVNAYPNLYINIMTNINYIPSFSKNLTNQRLNQTIKRFNEDTNSIIEDIETKKDISEKELKQIKDDFNNEKNNIKTDVDSFRKQLEILKESYDTQQKLNQDLTGSLRKSFDEFKSSKDREFNDLQYSFIEDNKKRNEKDIEFANKIKENLEQKKADVEKLWGIIGKSAISGQAQSYASTAYWLANIATVLSLLFLLFACWLSIDFIKPLVTAETDITFLKVLIKISATFILFTPSLYCMNFAKRQRDREFQLRDFEIKTAALEPFIEHMKFSSKENSPKDVMKLSLTQSFFDINFSKENKHHKEILIPKDVRELVTEIVKSIKEKDINKIDKKN